MPLPPRPLLVVGGPVLPGQAGAQYRDRRTRLDGQPVIEILNEQITVLESQAKLAAMEDVAVPVLQNRQEQAALSARV